MNVTPTARFAPRLQVAGLVVTLAIVALAASLGGWLTSTSLDTWYDGLEKPSWTPSGAVIGSIWTMLYAMMGFAAWLVWRSAGMRVARVALALFGVQLVLNVGWSALFFGARSLTWGLVEIVVLWSAVLATTVAFWRHSRLASALMIPYLVWVAFATYLTFSVWQLNP